MNIQKGLNKYNEFIEEGCSESSFTDDKFIQEWIHLRKTYWYYDVKLLKNSTVSYINDGNYKTNEFILSNKN